MEPSNYPYEMEVDDLLVTTQIQLELNINQLHAKPEELDVLRAENEQLRKALEAKDADLAAIRAERDLIRETLVEKEKELAATRVENEQNKASLDAYQVEFCKFLSPFLHLPGPLNRDGDRDFSEPDTTRLNAAATDARAGGVSSDPKTVHASAIQGNHHHRQLTHENDTSYTVTEEPSSPPLSSTRDEEEEEEEVPDWRGKANRTVLLVNTIYVLLSRKDEQSGNLHDVFHCRICREPVLKCPPGYPVLQESHKNLLDRHCSSKHPHAVRNLLSMSTDGLNKLREKLTSLDVDPEESDIKLINASPENQDGPYSWTRNRNRGYSMWNNGRILAHLGNRLGEA